MSAGFEKEHPKDAHPKPPFPGQTQDPPGIEGKMNPRPDYGENTYEGNGKLKDQIAIVTGGDSGIGRAVCVAFAREGADIAVSYLPEEQSDAEETKKVVEAAGKKCLLLPGDITSEAQCKKIVDETVAKFGRVDILVNNAAFQGKSVKSFDDFTAERVAKTFHTNIISMFSLTRHCIPHMKPGGCIINTGSIQAYSPSYHILDYATTKGAIVAFTKGLAPELVSKGIRVNCVAPGPVWTPLIVQSFDAEKVSNFGKENSPMNRPAQPGELAPAYVFLACKESQYVSGEVLGVTGGKPTG